MFLKYYGKIILDGDTMKKIIKILFLILICTGLYFWKDIYNFLNVKINGTYSVNNIPSYNGKAYIYINNNNPSFSNDLKSKGSFEQYSDLDSLGRTGTALATIGNDLMPTKERESIAGIKPSGWHTIRYDDLIEDKYLYNRCHLIGYQLTGENANEKNLITCTRQMNLNMVPFENEIGDYIRKTKNHVLYRVTPIYNNDDLLAIGVQMEALSVEDNGKGIKFNIFMYNVQDGIEIDYSDGNSKRK